jgi:hypothetical protein
MVKGVSRQVIVVHSPDPKLFDQAIFILKDEAVQQGITEEALLKEAEQVIRGPHKKRKLYLYGPVWACGGALVTAIAWLLTVLL